MGESIVAPKTIYKLVQRRTHEKTAYRGEIIVALFNDSGEERTIAPNDRIAQLVIQPYADVNLKEAETLNETDRGEDGFGSTGI